MSSNKSLTKEKTSGEQLAFAIAHDFKNVLNHIKGFLNILETSIQGKITTQDKNTFKIINEQLGYLEKMLTEIHQYLLIDEAKITLSEIDLNALIQNQISFFKNSTALPNIQWNNQDSLPVIMGDLTLLKQVFTTLFENAIKFSKGKNPRIDVKAQKNSDDSITISISDQGVGFNVNNSERLFTLFQKFHSESEFQGMGAGLAKAKKIITLHGGKIWANSKENEGATFYIQLPVQARTMHSGAL